MREQAVKAQNSRTCLWLRLSISSSSADRLASLLSIQREGFNFGDPFQGSSWTRWDPAIPPLFGPNLGLLCARLVHNNWPTILWPLACLCYVCPTWAKHELRVTWAHCQYQRSPFVGYLVLAPPHLANQEHALITCFVQSFLDLLVLVRARCVRCDLFKQSQARFMY